MPPEPERRGTAAPDTELPQIHGHHQSLDGIRAVAALMVLVFHVAVETGNALRPGLGANLMTGMELAVPLFFALSGILLYRPWARATLRGRPLPSTRAYLWRRAVRVLPAYWVVAVAAMVLYSRDHISSWVAWFEVLTLTFIYTPDPWYTGIAPPGLGQIWSLCTEVAFYLVLPVLALLLHHIAQGGADPAARARRLLAGLAVVTVASVAFLLVQFYPEPRPYMHAWLPRTLGLFAIGMALTVISEWAWLEDRGGPVRRFCTTISRAPATCWLVSIAAYLVACTPASGERFAGAENFWQAVVQALASLVFAFFFIAPIALMPHKAETAPGAWGGGAWLRTLMTSTVMTFLAKVSYGIFLWQFLVLYLWRDFTDQEPFTGSALLDLPPVVAGTLLLAWATYRLIEVPTRRANALVTGREGGGVRSGAAEPAPPS